VINTKTLLLLLLAATLVAVAAGWRWHAPRHAAPAPQMIAGWSWGDR
jgi:hypothetical protein